MKPYTRQATVIWRGTQHRGTGVITTPSAVLNRAGYTFDRSPARSGTNPPELVAAAQAGSFSTTLARELSEAGYRPAQVETTAMVTMEKLGARWTLTQIHLEVIATVPRVAQCDFIDATLRAKANCPISRSLNANISMRARLLPGKEPKRQRSLRKTSLLGASDASPVL